MNPVEKLIFFIMFKKIKQICGNKIFGNNNLENIESFFENNRIHWFRTGLERNEFKILIPVFDKHIKTIVKVYNGFLPPFVKKYIINKHKATILAINKFIGLCHRNLRLHDTDYKYKNSILINKSIKIAKLHQCNIIKVLDYAGKIITKLNNMEQTDAEKELYLYENKVKK